jgi:protease-4
MMRVVLPIAMIGLLLSTGCIMPTIDFGFLGRVSPLTEVTISGTADAKLVMLEVSGVITFEQEGWSFGGQRPSVVARLHEALGLAAIDPKVRGLVLRVRSPGGGVAASETLYHLLSNWKQRTRKPIVVFIQGVAASGGYYIAMAADRVVAHPSSITGSIGVIMPGFNVAGLMDRFGVVDQSLSSGPFKDSGSALRPMREEERAQFLSVIDDLYQGFVDVVDKGRPKLDRETIEKLADGRIYSANQALAAGLVDEIGHLADALERARILAGISQAKVVTYRAAGQTANNIYSDISSAVPAPVEFNVLSLGASKIPAGFYYLWPMALSR